MFPFHAHSCRSAHHGVRRRGRGGYPLLGAVVLALLLPAALTAEPVERVRGQAIAPRLDGCEGGLQNDDGSAESGIFASDMVMRFGPPQGEAGLERVCVCWSTISGTVDLEYDVVLLAADGPGGAPGSELARVAATAEGVTPERRFYQHDVSAFGIEAPDEPFYLGVDTAYVGSVAFLCTDNDGANQQPSYGRGPTGDWSELETTLMVRATLSGGGPPPPPGEPVMDSQYPDFRFWVRITGATSIPGTKEPECIDETVCFSGALPGRSEVFVRIVGPKPNGRLWPTLVKFSTSQIEVWIQQVSTGETRYYLLEGASPGVDELPGLFDRTGFEP